MAALRAFLKPLQAVLLAALWLLPNPQAQAGVDDCLKAALNTANPDDLKKAANFAVNHPSCLSNLLPPTLVPYVALSGSLDAANQSGALNKVGLGFSTYQQCDNNFNLGKATVKQLAPALKPVCGTLNMDCGIFEGPAADEVNSQLASEVPLLSLLPCSCAAASSGLGVEKIATLLKDAKQCGATFEQVAEAFSDAAVGVYDVAGDAAALGGDAASYALKLGEDIAKAVGNVTCAVSKLWGGCKSTPPSYKTTANAICNANHQGILWAQSKTQAPNDVWVQCNDGLYCWALPGENLRCEQRRTTAQRNSDIAVMKQWCPQRESELEAGYHQQCHDGLCKIAVTNVASKYGVACMKVVNNSEKDTFPTGKLGAEMRTFQSESFTEYPLIAEFERLIIESIRRDPKTPPVEFLKTYECRPFLGREEQSLCKWPGGFQQCKKLVDAGKMNRCFLAGGGEYPLPQIQPIKLAPGTAAGALQNKPANQTAPAATPISNTALLRVPRPATSVERAPIVVSDNLLNNAAAKGCRPFLGRRDDLLCDNQAGYDECVQAVNRNLITQCRNAKSDEIFPRKP